LISRTKTIALLSGVALSLGAAAAFAQDMHRAHHTEPASSQPLLGGPPVANEASLPQEHVTGDSVAAIVNDSIVSDYDVRQRVALFLATSNIQPTDEVRKQIREQVLTQLETERLELLEASKNNVTVSSSEVDKAIGTIMKDNNLTEDQLKQVLTHGGVQMATFRSQIAASLAWSKLVQDQLGDRVHISKENVQAELIRIKAGANKPRFFVSEIFEAVDTPEQEGKVQKDMDDISKQIAMGAPFSSVARQFSQNPTAAAGGSLGWVQDGQLPPELDAQVNKMRTGEVSPPIRSVGGYYLLYLQERQEPAGTKIPTAAEQTPQYPPGELPMDRILLPLGPKTSKDEAQRAFEIAAELRTHIAGCERLDEFVKKTLPVAQFYNLGLMKVSDLSPEIQQAVSRTGPGESTPPFGSSAGIEIVVRCDKAPPKIEAIHVPTADEVEQQLYEDQISTLARQYLRDLRRDADIETRGIDAQTHTVDNGTHSANNYAH
jgi:peptidyl-prolyl cis-trans isomerase SurA